ncbi:hypothetical protein HNE_2509 [Hyphomonas neptunium ATCC 15444]|uniref:Uncharacterized protein n=2 Tax=Hyphomonas TaxID=85 RepID=Q0BZ90_HYPNA|nr:MULTISPECIES: hypothetical protein [Hyphomonas]ABI77449.1 hypothetical protein HNE_2509 [Hyphomonas neptunium ATCC 15444]KCZ95292.1 hypothetical protein HHI_06464 [Hyphomonas hirschiana VP5]
MSSIENVFLPGVPKDYILERLAASPGNEIASGKLLSPASSAALAINCIGWFIEQANLFPPLPGLEGLFPAEIVDVEFQARFPWRGGHHPWLDGVVITKTHLIGIESKRYEPFRDAKKAAFSDAYERPVWEGLEPYAALKDALRSNELRYQHLDAVQLIKHALGLCTEAKRRELQPALFYLYAEPAHLLHSDKGRSAIARHRAEIAEFSERASSARIQFAAASYNDWIGRWPTDDRYLAEHAKSISFVFEL